MPLTEEKPSAAFFYITNQGSVNVRRSSDYIPKMIELAGGRYIFGHLGDDGKRSSTVNMQMEEFYAAAKESDYLIYNSTIDGEIHSISELLAKAPVLKDFKAVQAGNVWRTTKNLYQESMSVGAMLEDIHAIFSGSQEDGTYLYKLQSRGQDRWEKRCLQYQKQTDKNRKKNKETWRRQADRCGSQAHFCF